jgi:hypothetical protein
MNTVSDEELKARIRMHMQAGEQYDEARSLIRLGASFANSRYARLHQEVVAENRGQGSAAAVSGVPDQPKVRDRKILMEEIKTYLLKEAAPCPMSDIAKQLKASVGEIVTAIEGMHESGYNLVVSNRGAEIRDNIAPGGTEVIDVTKFASKHHKYGLTADNHLASSYARLDVLNALFDIWKAEGVETVFQCGNILDGECRFNIHDLLAHGIGGQVQYLIDNWPQREGIVTKFITGDDHEGWWIQREGINIGRHIQQEAEAAGRNDLQYIGHMEKTIELKCGAGSSLLRLIHAGGGSAYATSYTAQKIVESYQGGEKPNILLIGHYHKFEYGYPREVHTVQPGCTSDQSPFMRKKKIAAHVGGCTIEFDQDDRGIIHNFKVAWMPFYDRGFYTNVGEWRYHHNEKGQE